MELSLNLLVSYGMIPICMRKDLDCHWKVEIEVCFY